jgi:hypothetical protein
MDGWLCGNRTIALTSQPMPRRSAVLPRGSRHMRVVAVNTWRSRLVFGPTAGGDPDEFRDAGGDLAGGDRWPAARVAAALASAGHLGGLAAGIVLGTTGSVRLQGAQRDVYPKVKAGCWTRRRAFAQLRQGPNIQLLPYP